MSHIIYDNGVPRDANPDEVAEFKRMAEQAAVMAQVAADRAAAVASARAKLAKLGLTDDEIDAFLA